MFADWVYNVVGSNAFLALGVLAIVTLVVLYSCIHRNNYPAAIFVLLLAVIVGGLIYWGCARVMKQTRKRKQKQLKFVKR
jgi:membrane protein DedA with SNARE-associated domain